MGRVFGILLMVFAIWVAVQFHTKGSDGAFGGAFSSQVDQAEQSAGAQSYTDLITHPSSTARRMGEMVERSQKASEDRHKRMLESHQQLFE